jgi:hypothetical protein
MKSKHSSEDEPRATVFSTFANRTDIIAAFYPDGIKNTPTKSQLRVNR